VLDIITPLNHKLYCDTLEEMFELRYRVLIEHDDWKGLHTDKHRETDDFDTENSYYVVSRVTSDGPLVGCLRFCSSLHPTLSSEVFPHLFKAGGLPATSDIFDVSRFLVDPRLRSSEHQSPISNELFCSWMEFGVILGLAGTTAVVEMKHLQHSLASGMDVAPLGLPVKVDGMEIIGVKFATNQKNLKIMRAMRAIDGPVFSRQQEIDLLNAREIELADLPVCASGDNQIQSHQKRRA